jgi:hypothetical protein
MSTTIKSRSDASAWQKRYDATAPRAGDLATDFELYDANGANPARLSDYHGIMPVALVFGSFT